MVLEGHFMYFCNLISFIVEMNLHTIHQLVSTPIPYKSPIICIHCLITNINMAIIILISIGIALYMLEFCFCNNGARQEQMNSNVTWFMHIHDLNFHSLNGFQRL